MLIHVHSFWFTCIIHFNSCYPSLLVIFQQRVHHCYSHKPFWVWHLQPTFCSPQKSPNFSAPRGSVVVGHLHKALHVVVVQGDLAHARISHLKVPGAGKNNDFWKIRVIQVKVKGFYIPHKFKNLKTWCHQGFTQMAQSNHVLVLKKHVLTNLLGTENAMYFDHRVSFERQLWMIFFRAWWKKLPAKVFSTIW